LKKNYRDKITGMGLFQTFKSFNRYAPFKPFNPIQVGSTFNGSMFNEREGFHVREFRDVEMIDQSSRGGT
jgi:hypothetical protein